MMLNRNSKEEASTAQTDWFNFLTTISLHCYQWVVDPTRHRLEKFMWCIVHLIGIIAITFVLINAWNNYTTNPLITNLYDTLYPIKKVPFPGISICNNNRISRIAAENYAQRLASMDTENRNSSFFLEQLSFLGRLTDFQSDDGDPFLTLQEFLYSNSSNPEDNIYDTTSIINKISPKCSELLIKCMWKGKLLPCISSVENGSMFTKRTTQYGYCCTFNYVRRESLKDEQIPPFTVEETGPNSGIIVLLNGSLNDYYYPLYNFVGFIVQVFNPLEFPDVPSGGVSEKFLEPGTETFIRVDSFTLLSLSEVKSYSPNTRGCLFESELSLIYAGKYKRSDCVINCRVRSIVTLCNCVPYFLPTNNYLSNFKVNLSKCTLEHVSCLNHYNNKWSTVLLTYDAVPGLEKEMEDGLYCPECLPACSDTQYKISSTSLPLVRATVNNTYILNNFENTTELAILRIYMGNPGTNLYQQYATVKWYEIISNLGGMCGLITGFSIIGGVEIIYFLLKRIITEIIWIIKPSTETSNIVEDFILYP